jgi:AraC family transcriptional regulator, regulatory protein of adaptative response / DNA-3-methyladenine glycosylase II
MRALHRPDAFAAGDLALQKAVMPGQRHTDTERQLIARASEWQPWRSYATMLLEVIRKSRRLITRWVGFTV